MKNTLIPYSFRFAKGMTIGREYGMRNRKVLLNITKMNGSAMTLKTPYGLR